MNPRHHGHRATGKRQLRVGEEIRHALARVLTRERVHDEALAGVSITVTAVDVSADLRNATAYVTPLGGNNYEEVVAALNRAKGWLGGRVAAEVRLKYAPRLTFRFDPSFDNASAVDRLLQRPEVARDLLEREDDDGA